MCILLSRLRIARCSDREMHFRLVAHILRWIRMNLTANVPKSISRMVPGIFMHRWTVTIDRVSYLRFGFAHERRTRIFIYLLYPCCDFSSVHSEVFYEVPLALMQQNQVLVLWRFFAIIDRLTEKHLFDSALRHEEKWHQLILSLINR